MPARAASLAALAACCGSAAAAAANCSAPPAQRLKCGAAGADKSACPTQCCWDDYNNWCFDTATPGLPVPLGEFSANLTQHLIMNGNTLTRSTWMFVQLDVAGLRFRMEKPSAIAPVLPGSNSTPRVVPATTMINNGSYTFTIQDGVCHYRKTGAPSPGAMPFSMLIMDKKAVRNGTATIDGIETEHWHAERGIFTPKMHKVLSKMDWYVARLPGTAAPVIVRTDSFQNHNHTTDFPYDGQRDFGFSGGTFKPGTPPPSAFTPPRGCTPAPTSPPSARDVDWWDSNFA